MTGDVVGGRVGGGGGGSRGRRVRSPSPDLLVHRLVLLTSPGRPLDHKWYQINYEINWHHHWLEATQKSKQTFLKRQCKGFKINLRGRTKYFVLKIIEILHIHLRLLKRVTLDWFPLLIPGVGNCWLFQSFLLMGSEPYYWSHPPLHCAMCIWTAANCRNNANSNIVHGFWISVAKS